MRTSTAYFAGVGTVVIALAAGLGGGVQIANMMNPETPIARPTKLERHAAMEPSLAPSPSPSSPSPSSDLMTAQPATQPVVPSPAPAKDSSAQSGQEAAVAQGATPRAPNVPAAQQAAGDPSPAPSPSAEPAPREAREQAAAPETASTKAQASEPRTRDAETKRSVERRHAQHRQQWADQRRRPRLRDTDPRDVEQTARDEQTMRENREARDDQAARDDSGSRGYVVEPIDAPMPRFRLFDGF